ncbi:MAG: hypothetical protein CSB47_03805 [Proteobacteria bacterium]|nr:MAG: hypothetical protein CSB47_03805 [Pseudomonadota bacterium]
MKNDHSLTLSRRQFLGYSAATAGGILLPAQSTARSMSWTALLRLHPVRFIGGLIFSLARAVVVKLASDMVVSALMKGIRGSSHDSATRLGVSDNLMGETFKHANYKASIITLGQSDYRVHEQRQLALALNDPAQLQRFQQALDYLRDEKIEVRLAGMSYARPLGSDTEPDDLCTIDLLKMNQHQRNHYHNLISATGTTAFKDWSV